MHWLERGHALDFYDDSTFDNQIRSVLADDLIFVDHRCDDLPFVRKAAASHFNTQSFLVRLFE